MKRALIALASALVLAGCASAPSGPGCADALVARYQRVTAEASRQVPVVSVPYAVLGDPMLNPPAGVTVVAASEVPFCASKPRAVLCTGTVSKARLTLEQVRSIDTRLRADFRYVSDEVMYRRNDWWVNDRTCGDCEDYALILSERLADAGQSGDGMGLMIWAPWQGAAHATLMVRTKDAGVVEIGVGPGETPRQFNWTAGYRAAYMPMDGKRNWILLAQ